MKTFRQLRGFSQATEFDSMYHSSVRFSSEGLRVGATHPVLGPICFDDSGGTYIRMLWIGDGGDLLPCIVRQGYQLFVKP